MQKLIFLLQVKNIYKFKKVMMKLIKHTKHFQRIKTLNSNKPSNNNFNF